MSQDVFVRIHTAVKPKVSRKTNEPRWPDEVLVFDTETTLDTEQTLTLGAFRRCRLHNGRYVCAEEGLIRPDAAPTNDLQVFTAAALDSPDIGFKTFPPPRLALLTRRDFVEKQLFRVLRLGGMVVCFNLPFDLSRLATSWRPARDGGWSLVLAERKSRRTGRLEPNPERPDIHIATRTSRSAFVNLTRPQHPEEWKTRGRFLDIHTLAHALYETSFSLDSLCKHLGVPGKLAHKLTGRVTLSEIRYCRQDVRATVDALNGLKTEFDRHPVTLLPDQTASSASFAKAYFHAMGIVPPSQKFRIPDRVHGIAMQSYYGGRTETRVRHVEVPVILTDFKSQYPTVNTLLGNWRVVTAARLSFPNATTEVRKLLRTVTLERTFNPAFWKHLSFFALVRPEDDILPVRSLYNGSTTNIGSSFLKSTQALWFAGPDLVASVLLTGKAPKILRAIRMAPHGRQRGLRNVTLRGAIPINPRQQDFFRHVIEQRERFTKRDPQGLFLKTMANAGSYGLFVEVISKALRKRKQVWIFSGEKRDPIRPSVVEQPGRWYCPPLASLITAGGRLLLAMLERRVRDIGGSHLFCDTDSMCIVAAKRRGWVPCPGGKTVKRKV
ncbi:MAG TPA: hypothetical protein VN700_02245 [Vicinamibacterales bacterium]|nr:hypothetical protein [Vicinamibacterales bacterium]